MLTGNKGVVIESVRRGQKSGVYQRWVSEGVARGAAGEEVAQWGVIRRKH